MPAINVIQLPSPVVVDTEEERSEPVAACRLTEQTIHLREQTDGLLPLRENG